MLIIDDIWTSYGPAKVLRGVSMRIESGNVVALLGRNGAGKTTTLRSIMGIVPPTSGSIRLGDAELVGMATHRIARSGIAFVPDDRRIFPDLSVSENLEIAYRASRTRRVDWSIGDVYELFPVLREYADKGGTQLSGGEQKMLATGRALVQNPKVLLLDEAAEGLAPLVVQEFSAALRRVSETGLTILLADQNLGFARQLAGHGYIIDRGTIVHEDEMDAIWADDAIVARYLAV